MQFLIVAVAVGVLVISVQGLTEEQKAKVQSYYKECTTSTGVDPNVIHQAKEGKLADDVKVNEFMFCFFKKAGFMNDAGELQVDVIKTKLAGDLNETDMKTVLEKCNGVTGKDLPEKAANIFKCYFDTTPTHVALTI